MTSPHPLPHNGIRPASSHVASPTGSDPRHWEHAHDQVALLFSQPALPTRSEGDLWTSGVTTVTDVRQTPGLVSPLWTLFRSDQGGHEQVVLCQDRATGLKAVVAIHSTALGPALGGTRFHAYASDEEAVADALNLARGMSYKNALAGLDLGGGKAVIIGDPDTVKSEELLLAYGRFVASLGGRYVTACDVGTYVADMDVVARANPQWTTGRSPENGGAGDSSVLTAWGVFQGMRAAAQAKWGDPTLRGRRVGVMRRRQGRPPPGGAPAQGRRRGRDHRRSGRSRRADHLPSPPGHRRHRR